MQKANDDGLARVHVPMVPPAPAFPMTFKRDDPTTWPCFRPLIIAHEGLPNVLLEAQWVGTPVVTTDAGGAKEAIDPGVTGWCVSSTQPIDLAHHIIALHRDEAALAEARDMGQLLCVNILASRA